MTTEQINAIVLVDVFFQIIRRLVDFSNVPVDEQPYVIVEGVEPLYDRVTIHTSLIKPTLAEMAVELTTYKAELIVIENARLVELTRKNDLKDRWNSVYKRDNGMPAYDSLNLGQPNHAVYFRDLILGELDHVVAESRLTALETKDAEIINEMQNTEWSRRRKDRYEKETDHLFKEATIGKLSGNDSKWGIFMAKYNQIKIDIPKPEQLIL